MRFSELGECNHNSAAGVQTLERVTKNLAINTSSNTSCRSSELQQAKAGGDDSRKQYEGCEILFFHNPVFQDSYLSRYPFCLVP
jgi:hypothetical protein